MDWGKIYAAAVTAGGATASYLFGSWTALLGTLVAFVVADYITGVFAAGAEGKVSSAVGMLGIAKKVTIFFLVAVAHMIDVAMNSGNVIRDAAIFFYLANELVSIMENCGRLGLPVPDVIQKAVVVLKKKGDGPNA